MIRIFRAVDPEARVSLIPDLNKSQVEAIHASVRADARVNGCLSNLLPKFRHELGSCLIWALVRVFRLTLEQSLDVLCLIDKRENLGSTGVGRGLGLPHTKSPLFQELHIGVILFREIEFEYEAIDAEPVRSLGIYLCEPEKPGAYLKANLRWSLPSILSKLKEPYDGAAFQAAMASHFRLQNPWTEEWIPESLEERNLEPGSLPTAECPSAEVSARFSLTKPTATGTLGTGIHEVPDAGASCLPKTHVPPMSIPPPTPPAADDVERDDAIIGVAFRYSAVALLGLAMLSGGVYVGWLWMQPPPLPPVVITPIEPLKGREDSTVALPQIPFRDITTEAGITFVHENGAAGEKLLPETMGGGCAFLDYDSDGDQDLLFVNSQRWPWDTRPAAEQPATQALYQNDGTGKFVDVTVEAGLDVSFYGMSVAVGDYDNDGDADLCFTSVGQNRLFRNDNSKYVEITAAAGVGGAADAWGSGIGWFDYDHDGDLDLFVCRYIVWTADIDRKQEFKLTGVDRAYGRPMQFDATFPVLYRNNGDQTFTDVSEAMGIQVTDPQTGKPSAKSLGLAFADVDHDGWLDVLVANDTVQNFLLMNREGKKFEEVGRLQGFAFSPEGSARAGMGIDVGMFREGTEDCGIVVGNFANEMTALYVASAGSASFSDEASSSGLGPQTRLFLKFGVMFLDADLDGRLDLFQANGHLEEDIAKVQASQSYEQPAQLFWNAGPSEKTEFVPLTEQECGPDLFKPMVGRGAAYADIDNDGDLDILETACGRAPRLLRNESPKGPHWVRFALQGTKSNRDAIGAEITITAGGKKQSRIVSPTRSYQSQCEKVVTFGLGINDQIESATIRWPGGQPQTLSSVGIDRVNRVEQPAP